MAAADAIATVSLPWLGQRPAETYEQLCSSLLALDDAVEEVFGRVEKRCASENQKLQKLEERIASAQERARRITGSSAATVVLAAARGSSRRASCATSSSSRSHPNPHPQP